MLTWTRHISHPSQSTRYNLAILPYPFPTLSKSLASLSTKPSLRGTSSAPRTTQSRYYQCRRISSVRKYLTTDATAKLVTSLILSRLHYCKALLPGLPAKSIHSIQHVQNNAVRLVLKKPDFRPLNLPPPPPPPPPPSFAPLAACLTGNSIQDRYPLL